MRTLFQKLFITLIALGLLSSSLHALTTVTITAPSTAEAGSSYYVSVYGSDDFGEIQDLTVTRNGLYWQSDSCYYCYSISVSGYNTAPSSTGSVSFYATMNTDSWTVYDSDSVSIVDTTAPSVPNGLGYNSKTMTSFNLTWSASSDTVGVTAYEVKRDTTSLGTVGGTSKSVTGLTHNTTYGMKVKAKDAANNWSAWSSTYNVTTLPDTAAPTVTSVTASNVQVTSFRLNWSATDNIGVTQYQVQKNSEGIITLGSGTTYRDFSSLAPDTLYAMRVRAKDAANNWSGWSNLNVTTAADTTAPTITSVTSSSVEVTSFRLNWSATDNVSVEEYQVKKDSDSPITLGSGTTYRDFSSLDPDTLYVMKVKAKDTSDNWSGWSTLNVTTDADVTAPNAPAQPTVSDVDLTSFTLHWTKPNDNVGVTGYEVRTDGANPVLVNGTSTNMSTDIEGLDPDTTYVMTVKARDAAENWSGSSPGKSVDTIPDSEAPEVPGGLNATDVTATTFELNWIASTDNIGVESYEVIRDGTTSLGTTSNTYMDISGLLAGTTYTYKVRAKDNADNYSDWSYEISATKGYVGNDNGTLNLDVMPLN